MDWSTDAIWLLWLAAAVVAGLLEVLSLDLFFLMIAGGALAAALAAGLGAGVPIQVLVFAASTTALLGGVRPPLKRWVASTPPVAMHTAALVGSQAKVLQTVTENAGRVKLAGEEWSARVAPGQPSVEVGSPVHVVRIDGATAVVAPDHAPGMLEERSAP